MIRKVLTYYAERLDEFLSRYHRQPEGIVSVGLIGSAAEECPNKNRIKQKGEKYMNRHSLTRTIFGAAALLAFAACTQDELAGDGTQLPEGKYPLQIASVSLSAEVTDEPWGASHAPQTRVGENADGNSSAWEWNGTEQIGVQIGSGTAGTYTLNSNGITGNPPAYWLNTQPNQSITAWYPAEAEVSLADQKDKLAYVLMATATADFNSTVTLDYAHSLAKVRVVLKGDQTGKVNNIRIKSFTSCSHTNGADIQGSNEGWITMKECNYNGTKCWEANVVPDEPITELLLNGTTTVELAKAFSPVAGKVNKIDLGVGQYTVTLAEVTGNTYTVDPGANVIIDGESIACSKEIVIPGGKGTTVTLKNCILKNEIEYMHHNILVNGDATIILSGINKIYGKSDNDDNGSYLYIALYVNNKATLTIQAEDDNGSLQIESGEYGKMVGALGLAGDASLVINSGKITSDVKSWVSLFPGIGNATDKCGTITINGGEITATVATRSRAPGIGSSNGWHCEGITINGGTVTVRKGNNSPYDIGPGGKSAPEDPYIATCGPVIIGDGATVKRTDGTSASIYGQ